MVKPAQATPVVLAFVALALAGCGGDDDSSSSTSPPASAREEGAGTTGRTGITGTTGSTGTTGVTGKRRKQAAEKPAKGTGGSGTDSAAGTGTTAPAQPAPKRKKRKKSKPDGPQYPASVGRELAKQAQVVCGAFTLDQLVEQYQPKSRDPKDVAEAYAAGYAVSVRKAVAAGCEEGIRESQGN